MPAQEIGGGEKLVKLPFKWELSVSSLQGSYLLDIHDSLTWDIDNLPPVDFLAISATPMLAIIY